jgi:hypothetical protein
LILRLHEKRPEDRIQSAEEVVLLLTDCLAHLNQPALHPLPKELRMVVRKRRPVQMLGRTIAVATLCGLVAALLFFGIGNWFRPAVQPSTTSASPSANPPSTDSSGRPANRSSSSMETNTGAAEQDVSENVELVESVVLPWDSPETVTTWDDQLTPLLKSIEQTLEKQLEP